MRLAPSALIFWDTATVELAGDAPDAHGGDSPTFTSTGAIACYVESVYDKTHRKEGEEHGEIGSETDFRIYTSAEPGALAGVSRAMRVDDVVVWQGKTLKTVGPAFRQSYLWIIEAKEYR